MTTNTAIKVAALNIDLTAIDYTTVGKKSKETDLAEFFTEKVLEGKPAKVAVFQLQGNHKLIISKVDKAVSFHHIRTVGTTVGVAKVAKAALPEVKPLVPADFKERASSTKEVQTIWGPNGEVLRQAPTGKNTVERVLQLEILANEFVTQRPGVNFGIALRPAIWKGNPVSIMMTVYAESDQQKAASNRKEKITLLSNPDKIEEWLADVQRIYNDCEARLMDVPIEHESGFKFDRKAWIENKELIVLESKKVELTSELINTLKRIMAQATE